jgi:hypothetical protein
MQTVRSVAAIGLFALVEKGGPSHKVMFRLVKIDGPVHDLANHTRWFGPFPMQYAGPEADERLGGLRHMASQAGARADQVIGQAGKSGRETGLVGMVGVNVFADEQTLRSL